MFIGLGLGLGRGVGRGGRLPWVPAGASLVVDFENSRFYWGGEEKALSDLTETANGYYLDDVSWWNESWTFCVEYTPGPLETEQHIFSLGAMSGTDRIELYLIDSAGYKPRLYYNPPNTNCDVNQVSRSGDGSPFNPYGRTRVMFAVTPDAVPWSGWSGKLVSQFGSNTPGTATTVNRTAFGFRAKFSDKHFLGTLHRVVCWPTALSQARIESVLTQAERPHLHLLGDSFATSVAEEKILALTTARYIPFSRDGVGGSTLAQQATRFAAMPARYRDATLLIMDGGATGTSSEAISALNDITSLLTHDRWAYIEPGFGTNHTIGSPNRTAYDAWLDTVRAHCGEGHFIPTYDAMLAANDGGSQDLQDVADGIWPTSLRSDGLHPNEAGLTVLASCIVPYCELRGWM